MATKRSVAGQTDPATANPEPTYSVTIRLQEGMLGGDATVHLPNMPEHRVWALLRDEVAFIRLPEIYSSHPGGETKFLNRDQILELHIYPAWPHAEPW